ncbi:autotransporter outer membrane beta-barrel domain-containing protein [Phascolarctobacterium faecium]|uniref:autotransporter outer membrane beta-barrel domain-containing protein n=1 Tax=Phascolarctobacterium faecium TaxID=33025 RepID=UPI00300F280B
MNKKVLSKKVMISLLTMSCVYLGGTSALPIAEASSLEGATVDGNQTYSFGNGYTIKIDYMGGGGRPIGVTNGENMTINAEGDLKITGGVGNGTVNATNATLNFTGKNIALDVPNLNGAIVTGLLAEGGIINFKNEYTKLTVNSTNEYNNKNYVVGIANGGAVNFDHAVDVYGSATKSGVYGLYATEAGSSIHAKEKVTVETVGGNTNTGIQISDSSSAVFDDALSVITRGDSGFNYGVYASAGGRIEAKDTLNIDVSGAKAKVGLQVQGNNSAATISGAADISLATGSSGFAVVTLDHGKIDFDNAVFINKNNSKENHFTNAAIAAQGNSTLNINQSGGNQVVIKGGINVKTGGHLNLKMDRADSLLEGFIMTSNDGSYSNINLSNGAVWRVSNVVTIPNLVNTLSKLELNNATVDMTFDDTAATKVAIADYSGTGGNFIMDTDLAAETGDKVNITSSAGGTTYVQVKDASLVNGHTVTGAKNLLLITDASENVNFVGKNLNAGGLWDVTPTLENGENVTLTDGSQGTKDQWYLTKLAKQVNNDTKVLLENGDGNYALWRNTNDTLRKHLGDLHNYQNNKEATEGIWSRYIGGKFGSGNFDGSFNMYQLGYDKAADAKSIYGFAVENGSGSTNYSYGSGKDKLFAGSIYGTWYGDNSSYTDVVARFGQFDTDIRSYGDYPDKAKAKSRAYSLSVEYGKTIELNKAQGTFIEPQAQLIIGRLGSSSYTTDRGNNVYMGGVNSCIGRLGVVAGKKDASGNDVYLKVNMLHEFGGNRDVRMLAGNGETLSESQDYGDTWFELGLGGNIKLGNSSHLYGDIERSFGADIQKKWQVNAGVRFEF